MYFEKLVATNMFAWEFDGTEPNDDAIIWFAKRGYVLTYMDGKVPQLYVYKARVVNPVLVIHAGDVVMIADHDSPNIYIHDPSVVGSYIQWELESNV